MSASTLSRGGSKKRNRKSPAWPSTGSIGFASDESKTYRTSQPIDDAMPRRMSKMELPGDREPLWLQADVRRYDGELGVCSVIESDGAQSSRIACITSSARSPPVA